MNQTALLLEAVDRIEAARLRLQHNNGIPTADVVEILKAIPTPVVTESDENKIAKEIIKELKRLTAALERPQARPEAPTVNVSPTPVTIAPPSVSISPSVSLDTPRRWQVNVTEHFQTGPSQGKIKQVEFVAL